jgi:hypothetical protein
MQAKKVAIVIVIIILIMVPLSSAKTTLSKSHKTLIPSSSQIKKYDSLEIGQTYKPICEHITPGNMPLKKNISNKFQKNAINTHVTTNEQNEKYKVSIDFPEGSLIDFTFFVDVDAENILIIENSDPQDFMTIRYNVPLGPEAIQDAELILAQYGGIPEDAIFSGEETVYWKKYNPGDNNPVESYPVYTKVTYSRRINDKPVVGGGGTIEIYLGSNGELLRFYKIWHKISSSEPIKIVSANEAYERLKQGNTLNGIPVIGRDSVCFNSIELGYFEKGPNGTLDRIDPVWIFSGFTETNKNPVMVIVDALK